jgi:ABC-2 type transport system ATP-binding protein
MNAVIELENLSVQFGRRTILGGLTASLSGRTIGLLGPNGAGKTTLLHTLLGFHPYAGTAKIFGLDVRNQIREIRQNIGYMPENDSFVADMSAIRLVRLMAELSGLPPGEALERAHEALFYVGLGEARYRKIGTYSHGMKQLVKLAQALAHGPRLIFLDEPTNGLDPPARRRMIRLIQEIRESVSVHLIVSSHLLRDVEDCCEQVLILKAGRIAHYCDLDEERRANRKFLELNVRGNLDGFLAAAEALGCECAVSGAHKVKMVLPENVAVKDLYRTAREYEVQIRHMNYKRDSLQDIFLKAMEEKSGHLQAELPRL